MTCCEAREYLFAFLDGELDAALSIELQRHLEHCPTCARDAEIERVIRRQLSVVVGWHNSNGSDQVLQKVMAQVRSAEKSARQSIRRWFPLRLQLLGLAAVMAILIVGGWFSFRRGQANVGRRHFTNAVVADFEHFITAGKPLQLKSADAIETSAWLLEQTRVAVALPVMQHDHCTLVGARSCKVSGRPAAFAFYEIDGQPASLIAVQGSEADLAGMQSIATEEGSHWVDRSTNYTVVACKHEGLVYAAVSKLGEDRLSQLMPGAADRRGQP